MPKLLAFMPCEKVIIAQDDNNPTLVAMLTEMGITVDRPAGSASLPSLLPSPWSVFTVWNRIEGDDANDFEQRITLISPSGQQVMDARSEFHMEKYTHRIVGKVGALPTTENGVWTIGLFLRSRLTGADAWPDWSSEPMASYPLAIHVNVSSGANAEQAAAAQPVPSGPPEPSEGRP
jgi:hypothetical protein